METRFPGSLTTLAEVLQAVFVFAIVVLAVWRVIRPSSGNWRAWLRACATIGICGGLLGTVVITGSMIDQFVSSSGDDSERYALINRWSGPYWWSFWGRPLSLIIMSVLLFVARKRSSWWIAWTMALLLSILLGLLIIVITSLHRDYLPSSWMVLRPGWSALVVPIMLLFSAGLTLWAQWRATCTGTNNMN
jgi:hypothetical protein